MTITATPTLTVGEHVPAQTFDGGAELLAVDDLRLTWGRSAHLEQPAPAHLDLTLLDRSAGSTFARRADLIGQEVVAGWAGSDGSNGINFRGRITAADAAPQRLPHRADGAFRVQLAADSLEVGLANHKVGGGVTYPAETFTARRDRIAALIPSGRITGGVSTPTRFDLGLADPATVGTDLGDLTAAQVDASGKSALELLRSLFLSMSPLPMIYDPQTDGLRFARRWRYAYGGGFGSGTTSSALLVPGPDGYVLASFGAERHLDAGQLEYAGTLAQRLDARITRVEVRYLDGAASWAPRMQSHTIDFPSEATTGRRILDVDTVHGSQSGATQLAALYADVADREARDPRMGALGWSSAREPLPDAAHAALLLAGCEQHDALFIGRSWLTQLGRRPLVGILGGTVTYADGQWSVELVTGPAVVDPQGFAYRPLIVADAGTVTLAQLAPSVSFGDLSYLDTRTGSKPDTVYGYRGNSS